MDSVGKQCQSQLVNYQRCIYTNRENPSACISVQQELARCASEAAPILQNIKKMCGKYIMDYDQCLLNNQHATDDELASKCTSKLRALAECTESVRSNSQSAQADTRK